MLKYTKKKVVSQGLKKRQLSTEDLIKINCVSNRARKVINHRISKMQSQGVGQVSAGVTTKKGILTGKQLAKVYMCRNTIMIKEDGYNNIYDYNKYLVSQNKPILPYEILVIDEYRLSQLDVDEFDLFVSKIASYGRASGIFLLISTQRASVDAINLHLRENIIHSVSFAQRTEGSSVIAGSKAAQKLTSKGKAVYSYINDREMKVPFFSQKYQQNAISNLENLRLPN